MPSNSPTYSDMVMLLTRPRLPRRVQSNQYAAGTVFSALMMSIIGGTALFKLLTEGLPERFAFSPEGCLALATGVMRVFDVTR